MKKLLTLLLTLCLVVASAFSLTACGEHEHTAKTEWSKDATHHWHACEVDGCTTQLDKAEHSYTQGVCVCGTQDANYQPNNGTPTKAELATAYKSVATGCWNQFGAGTVVSTSLNALPSDLPETDLEEKDTPSGIKVAKADAATMFSLIYMIGEYYENDNFIISDGVVSLPLTAANMGPTPVAGTLSMKPTLDKETNNVKLEMVMDIPDMGGGMSVVAYYNFDIDFNFTSNTLIGFNLVMVQDYVMGGTPMTQFSHEKMTSDGRYFWLKSDTSSEYQTIALEIREQFYTQMESAEVLTGNFDTEFNNYLTNGELAYEGVINSANAVAMVNETQWANALSLNQDYITIEITYGDEEITLQYDGTTLHQISVSSSTTNEFYCTKKGSNYFVYTKLDGATEWTETAINEDNYNLTIANAIYAITNNKFAYSDFFFDTHGGVYRANESSIDANIQIIVAEFNDGKLLNLSYTENGVSQSYAFNYDSFTLNVPQE